MRGERRAQRISRLRGAAPGSAGGRGSARSASFRGRQRGHEPAVVVLAGLPAREERARRRVPGPRGVVRSLKMTLAVRAPRRREISPRRHSPAVLHGHDGAPRLRDGRGGGGRDDGHAGLVAT